MFFLIKSDLLLLLNFFGCGQKHLHKSTYKQDTEDYNSHMGFNLQ